MLFHCFWYEAQPWFEDLLPYIRPRAFLEVASQFLVPSRRFQWYAVLPLDIGVFGKIRVPDGPILMYTPCVQIYSTVRDGVAKLGILIRYSTAYCASVLCQDLGMASAIRKLANYTIPQLTRRQFTVCHIVWLRYVWPLMRARQRKLSNGSCMF